MNLMNIQDDESIFKLQIFTVFPNIFTYIDVDKLQVIIIKIRKYILGKGKQCHHQN